MKAAIYKQYGPPQVVSIQDVATPIPSEKEILIKVHTTTVNRTDCGFRSAQYFITRFFSGLLRPKYPILGCEFSGIVEQVGSVVTDFAVGDRITGYNDSYFGAHAEYLVLPSAAAIAKLPDSYPMDAAAALTEGAHYALSYIYATKAAVGQRWLVNGGTGAIGSASIQLLKHFGVEVTATCATPHIATVKGLGADRVIDYTQEDFTQLSEQFDVVFDAVGKSSFGKCKPLLKPRGIYVSTELGAGAQNIFLAMITPIFGGKKVLFPIPSSRKQDVELLRDLAVQKKFTPLIDRSFSLADIVQAYHYVETGQKIGNVLITVA